MFFHSLGKYRIKLLHPGFFLTVFFCIFYFNSISFSEKDKLIAKIGESSITSADIDIETLNIIPKTYFHNAMSEEKMKAARKQAFETIKNREMLYTEALRLGMAPAQEEIDRKTEADIKKFSSR